MSALLVIPARYASSRLPGKPLLRETGKYLLQHAWECCRGARRADRVVVATDDRRIVEAAESFGAEVVMTSADHPSGTDRVAEVARAAPEELVVNVQGDEPQLDPAELDGLIEALAASPQASMSTLWAPLRSWEDFQNPNIVKVVADEREQALYFSRSPLPHPREAGVVPAEARRHKGVYAYRREVLEELSRLPPAPLERAESLEQLRALHHGHRIHLVPSRSDGIEVNTPEDYRRFVAAHRRALAASGDSN